MPDCAVVDKLKIARTELQIKCHSFPLQDFINEIERLDLSSRQFGTVIEARSAFYEAADIARYESATLRREDRNAAPWFATGAFLVAQVMRHGAA